ncbi:hypothetical protein HHI36_008474 [Cryptolaemus montrouzieri]|uniref:Uncharacterized protein n=1 Tax=Cryptolaemus montrouzieri TaxID=559131 RepID=A0ABD2MTD3_9CUCU
MYDYFGVKRVSRKSSNVYSTVQIANETSQNNGYDAQCYKLFTAMKISLDFLKKNEIALESVQEGHDAPELIDETPELSIRSTSTTTHTAKITIDEDWNASLPFFLKATQDDEEIDQVESNIEEESNDED